MSPLLWNYHRHRQFKLTCCLSKLKLMLKWVGRLGLFLQGMFDRRVIGLGSQWWSLRSSAEVPEWLWQSEESTRMQNSLNLFLSLWVFLKLWLPNETKISRIFRPISQVVRYSLTLYQFLFVSLPQSASLSLVSALFFRSKDHHLHFQHLLPRFIQPSRTLPTKLWCLSHSSEFLTYLSRSLYLGTTRETV